MLKPRVQAVHSLSLADDTTVIATLSNSIQMDTDKAYIAGSDNVTKLVKGLYGK